MKKSNPFAKSWHLWVLLLFFIIGLALRTINLEDNIFFSYDQARDGQRVFEIFKNKDLKIVGPETDIPGVFNGPLFYYLLLPLYVISNFNPNSAVLGLVFMNLLGIFLIYKTAIVLFKNKYIGLIAAFLWAVSYEQANFSKYISNASLMPLVTLVFFLGLAIYFLQEKKIGLIISFVGLALSIQFNFYLVYLSFFYFIFNIIFKTKSSFKTLLVYVGLILLSLTTFIIAEIKFGFMMTRSLFPYFATQTNPAGIFETLSSYIQSLTNSLYYSIFSFNNFLIFILFVFLLIYIFYKESNKKGLIFLYAWLFSTLPLFAFRSNVVGSRTIHSSIFAAIYILFALGIYYLGKLKKNFIILCFFIGIVFFSNLSLFKKENFENVKLLSYQPMIYKDQKQLIDYTYQSSNNSKFSICAISNPLFINTLWSYLYKTYGETKYKTVPFWSGQKQLFIKSLIPYDNSHVPVRYLIIEPLIGVNDFARRATIFAEDQVSVLEEEKKFGEIVIQKRRLENNKELLIDTQNLEAEEILRLKGLLSNTDPRYSCFVNY